MPSESLRSPTCSYPSLICDPWRCLLAPNTIASRPISARISKDRVNTSPLEAQTIAFLHTATRLAPRPVGYCALPPSLCLKKRSVWRTPKPYSAPPEGCRKGRYGTRGRPRWTAPTSGPVPAANTLQIPFATPSLSISSFFECPISF